MARTPRPRVAGVERLLHIPRRGNRVPLDVAALSYSDELLLLLGLVVEDQTVPYAPPLGRRLRGASGEHERDEQREEQQPSTLHTTRSDLLADARRGCQCSFDSDLGWRAKSLVSSSHGRGSSSA